MRGVALAAALLAMTFSGCLGEDPATQSVDDGAGQSCTISINATSANGTCTSGAPSTSSAGNATGNQTTDTSGNGTAADNSTVGGNATGNATGNQTASPAAAPQSYSCTVDVGTAGFTFEGAPGAGNMGYCAYVLLEAASILTSEDNPSGCSTFVDTTPSDSSGGSAATVGNEYAAGSELGLRCPLPGGAAGGEGTIVVTPA